MEIPETETETETETATTKRQVSNAGMLGVVGGAVSLIATRLRLTQLFRVQGSSGHEDLTLSQCGRAGGLVGLSVDEVAVEVEVVVGVGVDQDEFA